MWYILKVVTCKKYCTILSAFNEKKSNFKTGIINVRNIPSC